MNRFSLHPGFRRRGSAIVVVVMVLAMMTLYSAFLVRNLALVKSELLKIEAKQLKRLSAQRPPNPPTAQANP